MMIEMMKQVRQQPFRGLFELQDWSRKLSNVNMEDLL